MNLLHKYSFENLPLDCFHLFIQLDPPAYVISVFIVSAGWKWQSHWLTLGLLEINVEPFRNYTSKTEPTEWFVPWERSVIFCLFPLCFCHMFFSRASPQHTHTLCGEMGNLCGAHLCNNGKIPPQMTWDTLEPNHFLQSWSALFPSRDFCNAETAANSSKTTLGSNSWSHPYPFVFSLWREEREKSLKSCHGALFPSLC